jgi:hypothetical protein
MKPAPAGPPAPALAALEVTVPAGFALLRVAGVVPADLEMCR